MAIKLIREKHLSKFTQICNHALQNNMLSLKARGLLATCFSYPPSYSISIEGLIATTKDGRESILTAVTELINAGYAHHYDIRENGKYKNRDIWLSEIPHKWPENVPEPETGKPILADISPEPETGKPILAHTSRKPETGKPILAHTSRKPETGKPTTENQEERNTINEIIHNNSLSIYLSREEREGIELIFHSERGYAAFQRIAEDYVNRRAAVGWRKGSGSPIMDKFADARSWDVRNPEWQKMSIFADDAAKERYRSLFEVLRDKQGRGVLLNIISVHWDGQYLLLFSEKKDELMKFLKKNGQEIKDNVDFLIKI